MPPAVVLVGPPGAGKTTVGRLLAHRLGVTFRDTDQDVETLAGKPIADVFVTDGEDAFRAMEVVAVRRALAEHDGVLALGGGAVLSPVTRERLRDHTVVQLRVGLSAAVDRVGLAKDRPVLALNPRATLRFLLEARLPLYQEVATADVDTDGRTPEEVAAEVASRVTEVGARD
ncbi:MAG TPA: shikimate kinase [Cryptosporangiaceae bacterium]|nr:shikimate kinase [Cryptosporangiaceae bacterium]